MNDEENKKANIKGTTNVVDDETVSEVDETTEDITLETDEDLDDSVVAEESAEETIKKLKEKLKIALSEKQEFLTAWQKERADFANARKRDALDKSEMVKYANENLVSELIPVLDSFNMAMANKEAWEKVDKNWRAGVEYIFSQLKKALEDNNVIEIDPIGQKFDPMRDEAIEHISVSKKEEDGTIISVIQKGYSLNGKVLKHPRVKVGEFKK